MSDDKLETLLEGAFRTELDDTRDVDVTHRILAGLERRNRIRSLFLIAAGLAGLVLATLAVQPALVLLVDWLATSQPLPVGGLTAAMKNLGIGIPLLLVIALTPWLLALLDDRV